MSVYELEIAGRRVEVGGAATQRVRLEKLVRTPAGRSQLMMSTCDTAVIGSAGLFSPVRLSVEGVTVFRGRVISERTDGGASGKRKTIVAGGPMDLAATLPALSESGESHWQIGSTTIGAALEDVLSRHANALWQVGAAAAIAPFDVGMFAIDAPIDAIDVDAMDVAAVLAAIVAESGYVVAVDDESLVWRASKWNDVNVASLVMGGASAWNVRGYWVRRSVASAETAGEVALDQRIRLELGGAMMASLFGGPSRLRVVGAAEVELNRLDVMRVEKAIYDFVEGVMVVEVAGRFVG